MSAYGYEYGGQDAYGGGGGGGGAGGFLQGAGDYNAMGGGGAQGMGMTSPQGGGGKGNRDQKTLLPLTVAQVLKAAQNEPDDHFRVDGMELHQVKVVGQIVDVEESATTRLYKVDDGTGVIGCRVFVEQDENEYQQERRMLCQKGAYVRVVGNMREYQGNRHISVHDMRPVSEGNEITHHLLEAVFVHCCNTKGRPNQKAGAMGGAMGMMQGMGNAGFGGGFGQQGMMGMGGNGMGGMGGGMGGGGLTNVHQQVLEAFQNDMGSDAGVDVSTVIRVLGQRGVDAAQVKDAVEFLANEGHIYTTTDETHYKATG